MMKMKKQFLSILMAAMLLAGCSEQTESRTATGNYGLFSWGIEDLLDLAEENQVGEVYLATKDLDHVPTSKDVQSHSRTIKELNNAGIDAWYLAGSAEWGTNPEGEEIIQSIEAVEGSEFEGLVIDVEPFTLSDYDPSVWLSAMQSGKEYADEHDVKLMICIPYWLDQDFLEQLLVCCDEVAVMNYDRESEVENLKEEWNVSQKLGKQLICISEVGNYDDLDQLHEVWDEIEEAYPGIKFAYHHAGSMQM